MSKRLTISISQIAPLVGLDAYNNFPRIICDLWRKYKPIEFKLLESQLKLQGLNIATSSDMNDIWEADEALGTNILQQVKDLNSNTDKTSSSMVSQQEAITKYINDNEKLSGLDTKQKVELSKKVCSATNKMHGIINEDSILAEFCRLSEKTIKETQAWLEIPILTNIPNINHNNINHTANINTNIQIAWVLVGKYDAITTDNELIEAKMRQKALFKKVRDYENVQVQLYLHALKFDQAYLVESYTNKKGINQIYVNEIKYDKCYVNDIVLKRIIRFIRFFEMFLEDGSSNIRESLMKGDKDRKIYKQYEREYLDIDTKTESETSY
jgi:hypothetical protein